MSDKSSPRPLGRPMIPSLLVLWLIVLDGGLLFYFCQSFLLHSHSKKSDFPEIDEIENLSI